MKQRLGLLVWITIAGVSLVLGFAPEARFGDAWLGLALIAIFAASQARYWKPQ